MSGSVAATLKVIDVPELTARSSIGEIAGGALTSCTTTVKRRDAVSGGAPLSATVTVMVLVAGPWASAGVQVNTPVLGSMNAPAGAPPPRLNVRVWPGWSGSVAE